MKKVIYSFLFCMCVMNIHAQLTLEATFQYYFRGFQLDGSKWKRIKPDVADVLIVNGNTVSRYSSSDFSLIETLNGPLNGIGSIQIIPTGLYKNDGAEYYLIYSGELGVYKKVGNNLILDAEVEDCQEAFATRYDEYIYTTDIFSNGTKCFVFLEPRGGDDDNIIKVYSFAGTVSNVSNVKTENAEMRPYPNPSREKIHLTFDAVKEVSSIRICDVNGRMVDRIPVGSDMTEYELDVHSYPEGVYFYEIDGKSQSFIVK